jgi:hypothetical protein
MSHEMTLIILLAILFLVSPLLSIGSILKILRIRKTVTYWISSLPAEGQAEIVAKATEPSITSPFSKRGCALWSAEVEERKSSGKGHYHWDSVYKRTSDGPLRVRDDTGEILVALKDVDLDVDCQTFDMDSSIRHIIEDWGVETKGFFGLDKTIQVTEKLVIPGQELFINGEIAYEDGRKLISSTTRSLVISSQSEKGLLSSLYRSVGFTTLVTIIIGSVGLYYLFSFLYK